MLCEEEICRAIDCYADERDDEAAAILEACIVKAKGAIAAGRELAENHYLWGKCLLLMVEYEQALLRLEKALEADPAHEGALADIAEILLRDLHRHAEAATILRERLIPLYPDNPGYRILLSDAERLEKMPFIDR